MKRILSVFAIALIGALIVTTSVSALVSNGNFETGAFGSWTKSAFINNGFSAAHGVGGSDLSIIVGGAVTVPLSLSDPHTSGAVRFPAYGHYSARVNSDVSYTAGGFARNANVITQNLAAFLDPSDGLAHIRFTYAAVMVNPVSSAHTAEEKPYFRVRAINTSNGNDVLYDFASYVDEPGKNWQNGPVFSGTDTWKYLNWNYIDLSPTAAHPVIAGNTIRIEITAAGCSLGGHPGYVYVDEITDGDIAGPTVEASGPATTGSGQTMTYTYNYLNGSGAPVNPTIVATQPAGVTFTSVSDPVNCALSGGTVTCNYTGVPAGGSGSFTVSGTVTAPFGAQIAHGNYSIAATGFPTLGGQTVLTDVNWNDTITTIVSDNPDASNPGQPVTVVYTVTALSGTPTGNVTITDSASAATCTGTVAAGTCNLTFPNVGPRTLTATYTATGPFNPSSGTAAHSVVLPDTTVVSINRNGPAVTNASSVGWTVTFAGAVSGLTSSHLGLAIGGLGGPPTITSVSAVGAQPTTQWTVTAGTGSGDGTLGLNMTDDAGMSHNVTNISFTGQVYTIDRTPPDTTITANPANPTSSASASFTFTGGGTYECNLDGGGFTACTVPQNYTSLAEGSHIFSVRAIDGPGNVDPTPAVYTWIVDTTPPDTTITANPTNPTNSPNAIFNFTGNDGTGTGVFSFECRLDAAVFAACVDPTPFSGLSDGSHSFYVRAIDVVGNVDATPASYTWIVDTTGPGVTIDQASSQSDPTSASPVVFRVVFSEPVSPTFTASDMTLTGTAGATTGLVTEIAPLDGTTYTVAVSGMTSGGTIIGDIAAGMAQDAAGNGNTSSSSTDNVVTLMIDTVTTITSDLPDPSITGQTVTVNYTVTAALGTPAGDVTVTDSLSSASCTASIAIGTCDIVLPTSGTGTLTATFAGSSGYNGSSDTEAHIVSDPTSIQFSSPTYVEDESQQAVITITRTGYTSGSNSVTFSTADGTATGDTTCASGVDYIGVAGQTVTFSADETLATVTLEICSDRLNEIDQTIALTLTGSDLGTPAEAVLTINDTATWFRSTDAISIDQGSPATPYASTINVVNGPLFIGSMRVTLYDLSTLAPDHLDVLLVGPGGQKFVLMGNSGGMSPIDSTAPVTLNFTDAAGRVLPDSTALTTTDVEPTTWGAIMDLPAPAPAGPYSLPGNTLGGTGTETLMGNYGFTNPNGAWRLYVREDGAATPVPINIGSVAGGWGLEFLVPTAADVSLGGRLTTAGGQGIRNARVVISGNSLSEPRSVRTGSLGNYMFDGLRIGETYVVTVNSNRFTFSIPSRVISLVDNLADVDFIAGPPE